MQEPKYASNPCRVCGAPMLGMHYHEADETPDHYPALLTRWQAVGAVLGVCLVMVASLFALWGVALLAVLVSA